jgi:hypothetical protein
VRIISCLLPSKSRWLNKELHWGHGKRSVAAPDRLLSAQDLIDRAYVYFACPHEEHLCLPEKIA